MLKVLHYVSKMDRAGQETFIMNLFRKIDRNRIQFDFLCSDHTPGDYDEEIRKLSGHIYYASPVNNGGALKQPLEFLSLIRVLQKIPCDVFHIHTHHAMCAFRDALAARLAGVKIVVVHSHNTSVLYHEKAHRFFRKLLPLLKIRCFACSEAAGNWMFKNREFHVLRNGLDVDEFTYVPEKRRNIRHDMGWEGKKIVGHIGRFNAQKNHRFLVEIFRFLHVQMPDTQLVLVGQGELEPEIRSLVTQYKLDDAVSFLGVRDDTHLLYQGMDLFLLPSLFEGLPVVLVEAQSCDLACLISNTITTEAILGNKTISVSLDTPASMWAEKAALLLQDTNGRHDARETISKAGYDIRDLADHLEQLYLG